jgi:hypothetical protein
MMERFKRGDASEEPRTTGSVATSTQREREAEMADDRTTTGDRTTTDRPLTDDDRTVGRDRDGDGIADDRTAVRDRDGDGIADDRTMARDRDRDGDGIADDRTMARDRDRDGDGIADDDRTVTGRPARGGVATAAALETARARQRDEYGGINWGAAFFGWLVAIGVAALLTAILAAAGAAVGLYDTSTSQSDAVNSTEEIGVGGGIALLVVLMIAYYAGGYVAGRMSRFDGARQGLGTWIIGLVVTLLLAGAAVLLGDQYNVLEQLNLPSLPVGDSTLATGGIIALAAIVLGTILAAMAGGKVGERYHRRVDRAGFID